MSGWTFRLAEQADAEAFSRWAAENPQIDQKDLKAGMKANNPTVLTFVAEKDGKAVAFAPIYLSAVLAHLGFDPEAPAADRKAALNVLNDGVMALMAAFGIREIQTLTKPDYPVAQWALAHHYEAEPRTLLKLDLNKEMAVSEV